MKIFHEIKAWQDTKKSLNNLSLGVVMTMGALHKGHMSLIKQSQQENDLTLVTIFVNPTQFNNTDDFKKYPNTWQQDVKLLQTEGVDFLLSPEEKTLYADNYQYQIIEKSFSSKLCGQSRPGHFEGMLTVVMKLLQISQANRAYYGEKDYQQLQLIQGMARAFFLSTQIIGCPIIRESDGLPFSSRNLRLTEIGRKKATKFVEIVRRNQSHDLLIQALVKENITLDYLKDIERRRFTAVVIDDVRLIDNFPLI